MAVSAAVLAYTIIGLGVQGQPLTTTPSFVIGISLLFISVQLLTAGVLAEILTRVVPVRPTRFAPKHSTSSASGNVR